MTSPQTTSSSPRSHRSDVALLDEQPADHAPVVALALVDRALLGVLEDAQRLLPRERLERLAVESGSEQHLDELLGECRGELLANRAVQDDDAAEGRDGIRGERLRVRLLDRLRDGDSARVRVLHDHARRPVELGREQASRRTGR